MNIRSDDKTYSEIDSFFSIKIGLLWRNNFDDPEIYDMIITANTLPIGDIEKYLSSFLPGESDD